MAQPAELGAVLAQARADLTRTDVSREQLHRHLARLVPAVENLLAHAEDLTDLLDQARTCPVTGLPTRAAWTALADARLKAGPAAAVVFADLDAFKPINDRFGHHAGDAVLAAVGQRLRAWCASDGHAGRLAGDEFVAVVTATPHLPRRIERLEAALASPIDYEGVSLTVGASIGVARQDMLGTTDLSALLGAADAAMYQAKKRGRRGR